MKHKTWKSGWVVLGGVLLLSIVQMGFATPAAAVITTPYDWVNGAHIELADPATETPAGRDITKIYYAVDASNNLNFKMDLSAVPTNPSNAQFSYVFYIDALSPTAGSTVNAYKNLTKSGGLTGQIDPPEFIIRYNIVDIFGFKTYSAAIQKWNGSTTWTDVTSAAGLQWNGAVSNGLVSGNSIEFQINNTLFNGVFNTWGATITPVLAGTAYATIVDDTGLMVTPIPSAAWLLGSGIVGLIGLKRRMARKA